jgi:hypothetical protein
VRKHCRTILLTRILKGQVLELRNVDGRLHIDRACETLIGQQLAYVYFEDEPAR